MYLSSDKRSDKRCNYLEKLQYNQENIHYAAADALFIIPGPIETFGYSPPPPQRIQCSFLTHQDAAGEACPFLSFLRFLIESEKTTWSLPLVPPQTAGCPVVRG